MTASVSQGLLARLGDSALLPSAYVGAAVCLFAMLAELDPAPARIGTALACAVPTALASYLLDRVKWRDAWLDPADPEAHPDRHAMLWPRRRSIRLGCAAALVVATLSAATLGDPEAGILGWWPATIPAGSVFGAWLYAGRPRRNRPRPKDRLILKNAAVGISVASLAAALALAAAERAATPWAALLAMTDPAVALVTASLALRVAADAIWCDLDDADVDRRFGTASVPARLGPSKARTICLATTALGGGLAAIATSDGRGLLWAAAAMIGGAWLAFRRPTRVRDPIELRLVVETSGLALLLAFAHRV